MLVITRRFDPILCSKEGFSGEVVVYMSSEREVAIEKCKDYSK